MKAPFALLVLVAGLAGCAAQPVADSTGDATLVIYQAEGSYASAAMPLVFVDGVERGHLAPKGEVRVAVAAGAHRVAIREPLLFWSGTEVAVTTAEVKAGQRTFVRFARERKRVTADAGVDTWASLRVADEAEGEARQ